MRKPKVDIEQLKKIEKQSVSKASVAWTVIGTVGVAMLLTLALGVSQDYSEYDDVDYDE